MKITIFIILSFLISFTVYSQVEFSVENKKVRTGKVTKHYSFYYQIKDTLTVVCSDSTINHYNPEGTIIKSTSYSRYNESPSNNIKYTTTTGEDSISKHFRGDELVMIYETRYDSLDRTVYYGMKDYKADSTYDKGFEWTYEYKDSITNDEKFVIQTVYVDDAYGDKRFHFMVINQYDEKNRKIKEIRKDKGEDPLAQIISYSYDEKDSLIEESVLTAGIENVFQPNKKRNNSLCYQENELNFFIPNFKNLFSEVNRLLNNNLSIIKSDSCENLNYKYTTSKDEIQVTIIKSKIHRERKVNCTVIYEIDKKGSL